MRPPSGPGGRACEALFPEELARLLRALPSVALAFSGGLDSRFLAHAAQSLLPRASRLHLFHVRGPHVSASESREAAAWAAGRGLPLTLLDLDPLALPEVRANTRQRCYFCKKALFGALERAAARCPAFAGGAAALCDGSNASDSQSFRPGLAALAELGVRSPLAEAGLDKESIRTLAARSGLDRPDQKARPCLLTRFAYGLEPHAAVLAALERAEGALAALLEGDAGAAEPAPDFRLRLTGRDAASALPGVPFSAWRSELHLAGPLPRTLASQALAPQVEHILSQAGFGPTPIRIFESLSGHYDRPDGPDSSNG